MAGSSPAFALPGKASTRVWQPSLTSLQLGSCPALNTKVEYQKTNWIALAETQLVLLEEDLSLEIIS